MLPEIVFLRPWWALSLPVLLYLVWRALRAKKQEQQAALSWFDLHLLAYLSRQINKRVATWLAPSLYFSALCISLFLTGPAIQARDTQQFLEKRGVVLVLDLGMASLATDIAPSRLHHARYKIEDLLVASPEHEYGLVVAGNDAYTIAPVSPDTATMLDHLNSLDPDLLPTSLRYEDESRLDDGVALASNLLTQSGFERGLVLVLGYGFSDAIVSDMWDKKGSHALAVWQFGTLEGGPIQLSDGKLAVDENQQVIVSRAVQPTSLPSDLVWYSNASSDLDIVQISALIQSQDAFIIKGEGSRVQEWTPIDSYFLFPLIITVFMLLSQPSGLLSVVSLMLVINLCLSPGTIATEIEAVPRFSIPVLDLPQKWEIGALLDRDMQSRKLFNQGKYQESYDLAQSSLLKALSLMAMNRFEEAKPLLLAQSTPMDSYYLGLAYFATNELEQALDAFKSAFTKMPDFTEAQENYDAILDWLDCQSDNQQSQGDSSDQAGESGGPKNQDNARQGEGERQDESSQQEPGQSNRSGKQRAETGSEQDAQSDELSDGETQSENSSFSKDQLVSKGKTDGEVNEEDIELQTLYGNLASMPKLDQKNIEAVITKVPNDPRFLLRQRLKYIQQQKDASKEQ